MKIHDILQENDFKPSIDYSKVNTKISEEKLKALINSDYSEAYKEYKKGTFLYRGILNSASDNLDFFICDAYKEVRTSKGNPTNYYNQLFSSKLSSWKNIPRRDKSIICSSDIHTAQNYGSKIFYVFPKNGTKIAICDEPDFWFALPKLKEVKFDRFFDVSEHRIEVKDLKTFEIAIKELIAKYNCTFDDLLKFKAKDTNETFEECLNRQLDPELNKINIESISSLGDLGYPREIWFSNQCLMIDTSQSHWVL
jgi:hypothetical protein